MAFCTKADGDRVAAAARKRKRKRGNANLVRAISTSTGSVDRARLSGRYFLSDLFFFLQGRVKRATPLFFSISV
jgi:hypothetical protein